MLSFEPTFGETAVSSWLPRSHTVNKRQEEYVAATSLRCVFIWLRNRFLLFLLCLTKLKQDTIIPTLNHWSLPACSPKQTEYQLLNYVKDHTRSTVLKSPLSPVLILTPCGSLPSCLISLFLSKAASSNACKATESLGETQPPHGAGCKCPLVARSQWGWFKVYRRMCFRECESDLGLYIKKSLQLQ